MQADAEAQRTLALGVRRRHAGDGLLGGLQRAAAGFTGIPNFPLGDREDGERRVADEAQHLPLVLEHGTEHAFEELVEQAQELAAAHRVGERRGIAQVAEPDHRVDVLAVAAADVAGEHLLAGLLAQVGVEDVVRDAPPGVDFGDAREGRHDAAQRVDLGVAEATGPPRDEARGMDIAVDKAHRQRQEVGGAFLAQLLEDREVQRPLATFDAAPDFDVLGIDHADRALEVLLGVLDADRRRSDLHRVAGLGPDEAAAGDIGMQRAHEHRDPVERHPLLQQPAAELLQHVLRPLRRRGAGVEPLDDRGDV